LKGIMYIYIYICNYYKPPSAQLTSSTDGDEMKKYLQVQPINILGQLARTVMA
jgi:hypothetical protein